MAELDEPGDESNFDLCGTFGLDFFSEDELLLTETDLTEQKETTKQTEIGQLNDEDIDNFITETRNRIEANCKYFFFCSGIVNLLFDGLTYITIGHFAHCSHFSSPCGARKNSTQLAKYPHVLYAKPSNKVYLLFHYCVILPYLVKRTCKI